MKQRCYLASLYLEYGAIAIAAAVLAWRGRIDLAVLVLGLAVAGVWAYVQVFPWISRLIGYGSVADRPVDVPGDAPARLVTLYTARGCPFCPIVARRLRALQAERGFALRVVDVTLRPDILVAKGIRAVPVVEVGSRTLVGHATTEQLDALIGGARLVAAA